MAAETARSCTTRLGQQKCIPKPPSAATNPVAPDDEFIYANVQDHYNRAANSKDSHYGHAVASAFGYSKEELTNTPMESNLGLSCGNPFAMAKLREGETVIDLGSGAGFDVFQAAKKVGASGRVVGVDMSKAMFLRARAIKQQINADNTDFIESHITKINLPDATADCIISNCVINLVPTTEKPSAFNEMFRLLKPKGRIAISDILLKQELPNILRNDMALYVGCMAGASRVEDYGRYLRDAGFQDILIVPDQIDLNIYKTANSDNAEIGCCGSGCNEGRSSCAPVAEKDGKVRDVDFNEWAGSFKIYAVKPET